VANTDFDIIVIGGGPAGYIAAIKAAQFGAKTALIEKDKLGGTCLNKGCIPTKNYLKSAEFIYEIEKAKKRGILINNPGFDINMLTAVKAKNVIVKKLTDGVASLLRGNKVTVYYGKGVIKEAGKVEIDGTKIITAPSIILAGGSRALRLQIPGVESSRVLTSDEILDIQEIPRRLVVIGGGVVGIEMAMIFNAFGASITVVEFENRILPLMDTEISNTILRSCEKKGIAVKTGIKLEKIEDTSSELSLHFAGGEIFAADKILLSTGRQADLSCAGDIGLTVERGKLIANDRMETVIPGVFSVGDLNGQKMLAHAAFSMGKTAAINAAAFAGFEIEEAPARVDLRFVPSIVYSIPEVGSVGLTEVEAKKQYDVVVGKFPMSANGRALASGAAEGFVKVVADKKYGEILGVQIVGYGASEIINEAAALMAMEITVYEVSGIIHGHPSVSEAFMEAAADCLGSCMHLLPS